MFSFSSVLPTNNSVERARSMSTSWNMLKVDALLQLMDNVRFLKVFIIVF
jgi:hypothetical protein